jgi:hypothetical protein
MLSKKRENGTRGKLLLVREACLGLVDAEQPVVIVFFLVHIRICGMTGQRLRLSIPNRKDRCID